MSRRSLALTAACIAASAGAAFARPTPNVIMNVPTTTVSTDGNTCYSSNGRPIKTVISSVGGIGSLTQTNLGPPSDGGGGSLVASGNGGVLAFDGYYLGANGFGINEFAQYVKISTDNGANWTPIPPIPGQTDCGSSSSVYDMSPDGRYTVGLAWINCRTSGYIYDRVSNVSTALSDIAPYGQSATGLPEANSFDQTTPRPQFSAKSVSSNGAVVVGWGSPDSPVVWDRDGMGVYHPTRLTSSVAVGGSREIFVSRDGSTIVGGTFDTPTFGTKWTKSGGAWTPSAIPINLTVNPSNQDRPTSWITFDVTGQTVNPSAISDDGSMIAGTITYSGDGQVSAAFIWTAATGTIDLWDYIVSLSPDTGIQAFTGPGLQDVTSITRDNTPAQNLILAVLGGFLQPSALIKFEAGGVCYPPTFFRTLDNQEISSCNTNISIAPGSAAGTGPFSYVWYKDSNPVVFGPTPWGSNIFAGFGSSLSISTAQSPDAGQYFCRAYGQINGPCLPGLTGDSNTMTLSTITAPVANDVCSTAAVIPSLPYTAAPWDVCHAPLNNIIGASCVFESVADVWFKYTPAVDQSVRVSMCGNNFDSVISVYTAGLGMNPNGSDCTDTEIACNDSDSSFNCPEYNFAVATIARLDLTAGQTYLFRAAGKYLNPYDPYNPGAFSISVAPSVPANDSCSTAEDISPATLPVNALVNNLDATTDGFQPECGPGSGRDVWFKFTPSVTADYRLSTCGGAAADPTNNAPFDTVLSMHASCDPGTPDLACNNNQGSPQATQCDGAETSRVDRVALTSGTTYYIRVASAAPQPGSNYGGAADANLNISIAPPFPANDLCTNAQAVSTAGSAPYSISGIQNSEASTDPDSGTSCAPDSGYDLWYTFTPPSTPANGWRIQLCGQGWPWNTVLSVHTGCVGDADNELACNTFVGGNAPANPAECDVQGSRINNVTLTQGVTYYIRVASTYGRGSPTNTGTLTIGPAPATPVNDQCAGALPASVGSTPFDLTEATPQDSAVEIGCNTPFTNFSAQDVWFDFNPPCTANYTFTVCGSYSPPHDIDPMLHVYANCAAYPTMPPLACSNDIDLPYPTDVCSFDVNQRTARISNLALTAGVSVRVRVSVAVSDWSTTSPNRPGNPTGNLLISSDAECGNCCRGTTCAPIGPGGCSGMVAGSNSITVGTCTGTSFAGCCYADFNHDGIQSIDDLFLYFNAYFTSSPWADFGGNGMTQPTIDDLFLYINAYFNSCS